MKTLGIILATLLLLIVLLGIGLQMFLTKGLTTALNQRVFPVVKSMYGLEMSVTNASVNLFNGSAELNGFAARNLKGYQEPYLLTFDKCRIEIEIMSLFKRDPVVVKLVEANGATLVIERNKEQLFNVKELADSLKPVESKEAKTTAQQPQPSTGPATATAKTIPVHIRRMAVDTMVKYVDSKQNKEYDLNLRLTGSDLFTVPAEGQPSSLLVLRGSMAHEKDNFTTDLNAILEPLTDPKNPTFNATGSILDIDASFLGALLKKNNMQSRSFSIKPSITCTKGNLRGSYIDLELKDFKIYEAEAGSVSFRIPIEGTVQNPVPKWPDFKQFILSEQGLKIGKTLGMKELKKQLGVDTNSTPREMLVGALTNNVKEISKNPALQSLIGQVVPESQPTNSAATNQTLGEAVGDALSEQLGKNVKGFEDNKAAKDSLKSLGNALFGK